MPTRSACGPGFRTPSWRQVMQEYRLSLLAEQDIEAILAWTHEYFAEQGRLRYEALLTQAIRDVAADPQRAGSHARPEIADAVVSVLSTRATMTNLPRPSRKPCMAVCDASCLVRHSICSTSHPRDRTR
jgi:plasmid stabilization system protein ParE